MTTSPFRNALVASIAALTFSIVGCSGGDMGPTPGHDAGSHDTGVHTDAPAHDATPGPDAAGHDAGGSDAASMDAASTPDAATLDAPASPDAATADDAATPPDAASPIDAAISPDATSPCGVCPTATTCGTANGVPVCRAASGIPRFTGVTVIVMENTSLSTLTSATNTPFISGLFSTAATGSNYHGTDHPSLPNYIAMTSGMDTASIGCDCDPTGGACSAFTCNALLHSCGCPQAGQHLGNQLEAAGLAWRDYGEDMGSACNTATAGNYAARHVPFLYYPDVQTNAARCTAHVVDYGAFDPVGDPQAFALIAPNLVHDMHDPFPAGAGNLANGDAWLAANVPRVTASPAFTGGGLLVIVWDEDDLSGGLTGSDDPIAILVLSPYARSGGYVSAIRADHYSLLATIEDGLGLARLGRAATATPLSDFFPPS